MDREENTLCPSFLYGSGRFLLLIHEKVIEKAKEYLAKDELTIAEVAYQLGFEYPQSFNKLFKSKTSLSPSDYKRSLVD